MGGFQKTAAISTVLRNCVWLLANWKTVMSLVPAGVTAWLAWGEKPWVILVAAMSVFTLAVWTLVGVRSAIWGERPTVLSARFFDIERVIPSTATDNIKLIAVLKFIRPLRQASLAVRIGGQFAEKQFVLFKSHEFVTGEQIDLVLAKVPHDRSQIAVWLPDKTPTPHGIVEGGSYIIYIDVRGRWSWQKQTYRIYFETMQPNMGTCARFIFVEEGRDLFEPVRRWSAHYG
jgi:hypothetical protein